MTANEFDESQEVEKPVLHQVSCTVNGPARVRDW